MFLNECGLPDQRERLQWTQTERCSAPSGPPPASDVPDHWAWPRVSAVSDECCDVWIVWSCIRDHNQKTQTRSQDEWAPDTVIRPWDRDPQGLSGLYLDLNFLKNNSILVIMTSSALIELTLLLPISLGVTAAGVLCTALYCIVLQGLLSPPGASVSGLRSLIIHTHNSHPGIAQAPHIES